MSLEEKVWRHQRAIKEEMKVSENKLDKKKTAGTKEETCLILETMLNKYLFN